MFRTTIQRLTFSYSLPLTTLYDFSFRFKRPEKAFDDSLPSDEIQNGFKRYGRLLGKLCKEPHPDKPTEFLLSKPKIYDKFLFESQKNIYNASADKVGYRKIEKVFSNSLIKSAAFLDEANPDYDTIAKEYPYYVSEKRKGVTFLEFILLLNYDLVVNKSALKTINNPIIDIRSEKLAQNMFNKLIYNLYLPEMFEVYVHAFFDIFDAVEYKMKNPLAEQNIKEVWLPEHYAQRKDVFRAVKTHAENKLNLKPDEYKRTKVDDIVASGNAYEIMKINDIIDNYSVLEYLGIIFAMSFQMLLNDETEIDKLNLKGTKEYLLAKEYTAIIKEYISCTLIEAEKILKCLYIENDSPLRKEK